MKTIFSNFSSDKQAIENQTPLEAALVPEEPLQASGSKPIEPEQVPYVPAASRTTKAVKKDKDEVVTVKKAKKRKADVIPAVPIPEADAEAEPSPAKRTKVNGDKTKGKKKAVVPKVVPEFDYSKEPNQLDTFAPESTNKIKKHKKPKKRKPLGPDLPFSPDAHLMTFTRSYCRYVCLPETTSEPIGPQRRESFTNLQVIQSALASLYLFHAICMSYVYTQSFVVCYRYFTSFVNVVLWYSCIIGTPAVR